MPMQLLATVAALALPVPSSFQAESLGHVARRLQTRVAFEALPQNANIMAAPCTDWPQWAAAVSNPEIIPAGTCVRMVASGVLDLPSGLHVQGRLTFPWWQANPLEIRTPFIFIEGLFELKLSTDITPAEHNRITFTITQSPSTVKFRPHSHNQASCPDGECDVGTKPVVVAGGKLDIDAMPADCPAWLKLKKVVPEPAAVPATIPTPPPVPSSCSPTLIDATFEGGNIGSWEIDRPEGGTLRLSTNSEIQKLITVPATAMLAPGCPGSEPANQPTCAEQSATAAIRCCTDDGCISVCTPSTGAAFPKRGYTASGLVTLGEAMAECALHGAHLCSAAELQSRTCCGTGCGYDHEQVWTYSSCAETPAAPVTTSSVPGLEIPSASLTIAGCPKRMPDIRPMCTPSDAKAGVRCCSDDRCISFCNSAFPPVGDHNGKYATLAQATSECAVHGMRLCSVRELESSSPECCGTGCGHDGRRVWTSDSCASMETLPAPSPTYLTATGRDKNWRGFPSLVLNPSCLVAGVNYKVYARVRVTKDDGSTPACANTKSRCLRFKTRARNSQGVETDLRYSEQMSPYSADAWSTISDEVSFTTSQLTNDKIMLQFYGADGGESIHLDDVRMEASMSYEYPPANSPCSDLISNGGLEGSHRFFQPFFKSFGNGFLELARESTNQYLRMTGRTNNFHAPQQDIAADCIKEGSTYTFSAKVRFPSTYTGCTTPDSREGCAFINVVFYRQGGGTFSKDVAVQEAKPSGVGGQWTSLSGKWRFAADQADAVRVSVRYAVRHSTVDVEWDDMQAKFVNGPLTAIEVDKTNLCWASGAEILITSYTTRPEDEQVAVLASVDTTSGANAKLTLTKPIFNALSEADDAMQAVEVALLDRTVNFRGEMDADDREGIGPHLIVMDTPAIVQKVRGIGLHRMGQAGNLGRYPFHLHLLGDARGTTAEKLLIRDAHQRCVVLHGVHNVKVVDSVAYNTFGHCYMTEDGGETGNEIVHSLGASTRDMPASRMIPEQSFGGPETDNNAATFWMTNPDNVLIDNVAAGCDSMGYWYEQRTFVRGPSRFLPENQGVNPQRTNVRKFENNVVHSCNAGFQSYPGAGLRPDEEGLLENFMAYRNRHRGVFFHNSDNLAVVGGYFADNRIAVDIDRAQTCRVTGATIVGVSETYQKFRTDNKLTEGKYQPCPNDYYALTGVQVHEQIRGRAHQLGSLIENVQFYRLGEEITGCKNSAAISVDEEKRVFFDPRTRVRGVTLDGHTTPFNLCWDTDPSKGVVMNTTVITDEDGSLTSAITGVPGLATIVADVPFLTAHGNCQRIPRAGTCGLVCPNQCYRAYHVAVPGQLTTSLRMRVVANGKESVFDGYQADQENFQAYMQYDKYRSFYVTLPTGPGSHYTASFFYAEAPSTPVWPQFTLAAYEDVQPPGCGSDYEQFVFSGPPTTCQELVKNGDLSSGDLTNWARWGKGTITMATENSGAGNHVLVRNRVIEPDGPTVFLDTRCLSVGSWYKMVAKVKLSDITECSESSASKCVKAYLRSWRGPTDQYASTSSLLGEQIEHTAGWNTVTGTFEVSDALAAAGAVAIKFDGPRSSVDIRVDDVSVFPVAAPAQWVCDARQLIRNADFNDISAVPGSATQLPKYWEPYRGNTLKVVDHGGRANVLLSTARTHTSHGPGQVMDLSCIPAGTPLVFQALTKHAPGNTCRKKGDSNCITCGLRTWYTTNGPEQHKYTHLGNQVEWKNGGNDWNLVQHRALMPVEATYSGAVNMVVCSGPYADSNSFEEFYVDAFWLGTIDALRGSCS